MTIATFKTPYTPEEVKKIGVSNVRTAYNELAEDYNKLMDFKYLICPMCGKPQKAEESFYKDVRFIGNRYPICKRCIQRMVEQRKTDRDEPNETKESVINVLRMLDRPYFNDLYEKCVKGTDEGIKEKNRRSPFLNYLTITGSLPQYAGKTWKDSEFDEDYYDVEFNDPNEVNENSRLFKQARNRFGKGYTSQDLVFLENQYQDWIKRYPCENKAQEILYESICLTQLNINKKQKSGKDTKDDLKTLQDLMTSLQIKPSQTNSNALTEAKTFGQLIEKWEDEWDGGKPIPEPDEDFKDVDKIGMLIDVFFKGHLSKMMGLKNGFTHLYEKYMKKYTVTKPEYDEDTDSEAIFEQLFGKDDEV